MNIEVDSIFFEAKGRKILTGAYLQLSQGEVLGLLGRNGSGKTTLYKLMFGLTSSEFIVKRVDGRHCKSLVTEGLLQYQTEQPSFPGHLSIKKAIGLFIKDNALSAALIEKIDEPENQRLQALSHGKRKYLESMILLHSPVPFLIMDEPFNGLSPLMVENLSTAINLVKRQKGIVVTDHRFNDVAAIADRLALMHSGTVLNIEGREDLVRLGYLPD